MLSAIPTIIVDTREKDPWKFTNRRAVILPSKLDWGDYSIRGMQSAVAVERKSVEDLFLTMTRGLERFKRELERSLDGNGRRFFAVIVEGSMERVSFGSRFSFAEPTRVMDIFYQTCTRYGVAPYMCDGRAEAESLAWRLLMGFWAGRPKPIRIGGGA